MRRFLIALFVLFTLSALPAAAAQLTVMPNKNYLPLASAVVQPVTPTPVPVPLGPQVLPIPGPVPQHVLGAYVVDCHPVNGNCYYFVVVKYSGIDQDVLILRLVPGKAMTELVRRYDGGGPEFFSQVASGGGRLLPNGDMEISFVAGVTEGEGNNTGFIALRDRLIGVDVPFTGGREWRQATRVEVQP